MCTLWNSISYFLFKECTYVNLYESLTGWESWWVFLSSPPSFDGFGGQHIGVDRTLIKSGTVSYTRGVLLPRGCLLAACFTGTSPRAASSSSHVGERLQRCSCSADTLLLWGTEESTSIAPLAANMAFSGCLKGKPVSPAHTTALMCQGSNLNLTSTFMSCCSCTLILARSDR